MRHKQSRSFSLDILAPELKLTINNKYTVSTKVGMILSSICLVLFTILTYIIISDYFDTSKPRVTQETIPLSYQPTLNYNLDKRFPIILLNFRDGSPVSKEDLPKYFTINLAKWTFSPDKPTQSKYYDVAPCAELVAANKTKTIHIEHNGYVKSSYLKYGYCVDVGDDEVTLGGSGDNSDEVVIFQVAPCIQGNQCKSKEEILKVGFFVTTPTAYTNFGNYRNPVQYLTQKNEHEYVNFALGFRHKYEYQKYELFEDKGFLSKRAETHRYFSVSKFSVGFFSRELQDSVCPSVEDLQSLKCTAYYSQEMVVARSAVKIVREYKGVVESISEVGGMTDILFLIFYSIYGFYNYHVQKHVLVKEIFGLERPTIASKWCPKKKMTAEPKENQDSFALESHKNKIQAICSYDRALELVHESTNIVSIARELQIVKVLAHVLLSPAARDLIPQYSIWLKQKQPKTSKDLLSLRSFAKQIDFDEAMGSSKRLLKRENPPVPKMSRRVHSPSKSKNSPIKILPMNRPSALSILTKEPLLDDAQMKPNSSVIERVQKEISERLMQMISTDDGQKDI